MMKNYSDLINDVSDGKKYLNLFDPSIIGLITEVGLNFFRFLQSLGISGEPNLVVLSSRDSYSCDEYELKNARVIVNMKKLNLIKHLDLFLNTLVRILPPDTRFIGYFSGERSIEGNYINRCCVMRMMRRVFGLFGSGTNSIIYRNEITGLLEKNGFKTLIMKEMNGSTYFISQNVSMPVNLE
jgi:hypothetical protein